MYFLPRQSLILLVTAIALLLSNTSRAQFTLRDFSNVNYSGTIDQQWALRTEDGASQKFQTTFEPRMEVDITESIRLTAIARVRADTESNLGFTGSRTHLDTDLREFYLDADWGGLYWRLGRQQIVWGQADGLRILDVINPQELREFILPKFEDSRIPLWITNVEILISDDWTAQLLIIPDQTYADLARPGTSFSMRSPQVIPETPSGLPVKFEQEKRPGRTFKDADAGARLSAFVGGWDVSLNYLYHYQDQAVLFRQITETGIEVTPSYERTHLVGGSFSNVFGDTTFRSEVGYSSDRFFLTNDSSDNDGVFSTGEFSYVLGIDYQGWRDWFVSGQLFQSILADPAHDMTREKSEINATFLLRRYFMNESLKVDALLIQNLNRSDGVLQTSMEYEWSTNITLTLGADIFFGSSAGLYGQFEEKSRITFGTVFSF
jgi:hypothetical protein